MCDELIELLEVGHLVRKAVRNLLLGERTIERRIRALVAESNRRTGAIVLLTSHYMTGVKALCRPGDCVYHGPVLFDGPLQNLVDQFAAYRKLIVTLSESGSDLSRFGEVIDQDGLRYTLRIPKETAPAVKA